jgi:acetyl-CoA carboxylase biotin carboxyl carrier protein
MFIGRNNHVDVVASMAGTVLSIGVAVGDKVADGQDVVVLESMKMEIPVQTEVPGMVTKIHVEVGDFVNEGDRLLELQHD